MSATTDQFEALFTTFLPPALSRRYCALLLGAPKHWAKIDPWKVWGVQGPHVHRLPLGAIRSLREYGQLPQLAALGREPVSVLYCGHASSELRTTTLAQLLDGSGAPTPEGFAVALQGRLGFVFNHDGGELILCAQPLAPTRARG